MHRYSILLKVPEVEPHNQMEFIRIPVLNVQHELTYINFVQTLDAVKRTSQKRWIIGMDSERIREFSAMDTNPLYIYIKYT